MINISGFGALVNIVASNTFPQGFVVSQFSDDQDPLDMPSTDIADSGMGANGDLVVWNKATPLPLTISVIPGSEDDKNLQVLFNANRIAKDKQSAQDIITLTVTYADGSTITYNSGYIKTGQFGDSIASAGRKKSKAYAFVFENVTGNN